MAGFVLVHGAGGGAHGSRHVRRTPRPRGCFTEPVRLSRPLEDHAFTRTYIEATAAPESDPGNAAFWRAARHAASSPAWRYREIASNHMVASNRPVETARLLAEVAHEA